MQSLHTDDGLPLHVREWAPSDPPRGTVLIVHGLGEHIGRYAGLAADLNADGWYVAGFDQRGHGASGGARGSMPHDHSLLADLARVVDLATERLPGPVLLFGHSLGGLVAARFVAEALAGAPAPWSRPVHALVLSSPALALRMNRGQRALLGVLGRVAPALAVGNGIKPRWLSRDPAVVQAYTDDPLVHDRVTPQVVSFLLDGGARVRACAADWQVPTLLLWAGADRCVDPAGSEAFAAAAPTAVLAPRDFPGLFHEIFNEPERDQVVATLLGWLSARR